MLEKNILRKIRHKRVRKKVFGTKDKPRLCVFRSLRHTYVQIVNDEDNKTLLTASTLDKDIRDKIKVYDNTQAAELVGKLVAKKCKEAGVKKVVFDRGGYIYHGRIKTLADTVRKEGLEF